MFSYKILVNSLVFLSLFSLYSCQKKSVVTYQKSRAEVEPMPFEIESATVVDWRVGPERDQTISRGVSLLINLPQLDKSDLERLVNDRQVDSWLLQLERRGVDGQQTLARTAVPLTGFSSQMKSISFPVQYAASALSMRRAEARCPSFNHRYVIKDVSVESVAREGLQNLIVGPSQDRNQRGRFSLYQVRPESINGGHRLEGDYRVEIAFFNREQKKLKSNFVKLSEFMKVRSEEKSVVKGCENARDSVESGSEYDQFKFGR